MIHPNAVIKINTQQGRLTTDKVEASVRMKVSRQNQETPIINKIIWQGSQKLLFNKRNGESNRAVHLSRMFAIVYKIHKIFNKLRKTHPGLEVAPLYQIIGVSMRLETRLFKRFHISTYTDEVYKYRAQVVAQMVAREAFQVMEEEKEKNNSNLNTYVPEKLKNAIIRYKERSQPYLNIEALQQEVGHASKWKEVATKCLSKN